MQSDNPFLFRLNFILYESCLKKNSVETVEKVEKERCCHSVLDTESIKNQHVIDSCFPRNDTKNRVFQQSR
jgi:hypothetical protein